MRCPRCAGNKRIMGIGYIECDCPLCKGIGQLPDSTKFAVGGDGEIRKPSAVECATTQEAPDVPKVKQLKKVRGTK